MASTPPSMSAAAKGMFGSVRDRVAALRRLAYQEVPIPAMLASYSLVGLTRLGEEATRSRKRRVTLLSAGMMLVLVGSPAAAQSCQGEGILPFLSDLHDIITKSAGVLLISMVIIAGILKMLPTPGTDRLGNALIGGVVVGVIFLVLGPALIDLAGESSPINTDAQC